MKLNDYCDAINVNIQLQRYANQNERWSADFESCDILEGSFLHNCYGTGKTPTLAIKDFISKISGKRIVLHAMSTEMRREFDVPVNLEYYTPDNIR